MASPVIFTASVRSILDISSYALTLIYNGIMYLSLFNDVDYFLHKKGWMKGEYNFVSGALVE
jgi:hypothetical protein